MARLSPPAPCRAAKSGAEREDGMPIVIEAENPADARSTLRVICAGVIRGENLTAAQAHVLVGEVLEELFPPPGRKPR